MKTPGRLCGPLLIATGLIHLTYGMVVGRDEVAHILRGGIGGAETVAAPGAAWFWFIVAGLPLLLTGQLVSRAYARTGEVPGFLGWYLLLLAALVYFMPAGGFWLFLPQAALAFYAVRADRDAVPVEVSGHAA